MTLIKWAGKNAWLGWLLCVPIGMQLFAWAVDRQEPFSILGSVAATHARPGEMVTFRAHVRRDLDRGCTVVFSRHLIDGAGIRHDYATDPRVMTADGLRNMDVAMGGQLRLAIEIPRGAAPGPAMYQTDLIYTCNPLHRWWPIQVSMPIHFEIHP